MVGSYDNYTSLERAHLLAILGAVREQSDNNWDLDDRYVYLDLNFLLCLREDRLDADPPITNNSLSDIVSFESWVTRCDDGDDGHADYSPAEEAAFALSFSGNDIENSNSDPYPYLRGLLDELAVVNVDLTSADEVARRRANERVQAALAFIFGTPFIFAEGE